jgi:hypothetical protein
MGSNWSGSHLSNVEITWMFLCPFPTSGNWSLISFLAFPLDQGGSSQLRAETNMYQKLVNNVTIKIELEMLALAMFLKKNNLSRMRLVRKQRVLFVLAVCQIW